MPLLTPSEIKEINLGLKLTCGSHLEFPAKMFTIIIDLISVPLTNVFNMCKEMYFSDLFEIARVLPVVESNDPLLLNNYQPISLTRCVRQ